MVDAVVGSVIMVVAATSLLFAVEVSEKAFEEAGRYPLNQDERTVLESVDLYSSAQAEMFWRENLLNTPREVGSGE